LYPKVRQEALTASLYDIVPTIAAPHSTSINAVTATPDFRYWFTGGADCYIRKYDGAATINGKTLLTVAQRHPFVDSVTKAGVLMSYWENEEPADTKVKGEEAALSPVYSLAVHREALWLLSGLESGCINLQSVRHDEGKWITSLRKHTSAVSVLTLASDEKSVLSGSWDKNILDWDLNTGQIKREFGGNGGQISAIELRPTSSLPVPRETGEVQVPNGTFSSNNADAPLPNGSAALTNGTKPLTNGIAAGEGGDDAPGSPLDTTSLFGDTDSLFGDDTGGNYGDADGDADDEFSRAIAANTDGQEHQDSQHDVTMTDGDTTLQINGEAALDVPAEPTDSISTIQNSSIPDQPSTPKMPNGLPHAEDLPPKHTSPTTADTTSTATSTPDSSASTFLAASFDGTLCVWDRRQPDPVARIMSRTGGPWCMGACWSPDGNYIYAGRRNNTVEEFSLHKGLKSANRTLKFPAGSGPVSAVRAMPNGRHLIW
jgi:transcriptional activator SPT8